MHATIPKGNMGYDQYIVPDDCSCQIPILSDFFEEQRTQNHPQCLSGLSCALFSTTFLEIAVNGLKRYPSLAEAVNDFFTVLLL